MQPPPPEQIDLGEVVLRRWTHDDVPALTTAVAASLEHLRPWMTWATEATTTSEAFHRFVDETASRAEGGSEAVFGIFDAATDAVRGGCGIHDRLPEAGGLEIGYWLHVDASGQGLMTRVAGRLASLALTWPGIWRVEIHCDEANLRSAAIPRRLGFRLDRVELADRPPAPGDTGRHLIWILERPR